MTTERIRQAAAEADQMIAELARGAQNAPAGAAQEADAGDVAVLEAPAAPVEPSPEPAPVVEQQLDPARPTPKRELEDGPWRERYLSLHGMIQARDRQIEQLHQLIASFQAAAPQAAPAAAPAPTKNLTDADKEVYGADMVDMAQRAARDAMQSHIDQLMQKIAAMEKQLQGVTQVTAETAQTSFESRLDAAAPGWRKTDTDPGFIAWLRDLDVRQRMYAAAVQSQNVKDTAYFYNEYVRSTQPAATAPAAAPTDTRKQELERQVAPGRSRAVASPAQAPQEKKTWTRSEIAAFFTNGRRMYSAEEYSRLERDIFAAQKEGRVDATR